jgi:hypothetical protein
MSSVAFIEELRASTPVGLCIICECRLPRKPQGMSGRVRRMHDECEATYKQICDAGRRR